MRGRSQDLTTTSPDGTFRVQAASPDNGTISHSDGTPAEPNQLAIGAGVHSEFRYRMLRRQAPQWERWGTPGELAPQNLYVSDDGWVVIQTEGYRTALLIAISPAGRETLRVAITDDEDKHPSVAAPPGVPRVTFDYLPVSTVGMHWETYSLPFFLSWEGRHYFWLVVFSGQRIFIWLDEGRLLAELPEGLEHACRQAEEARILNLLKGQPRRDRLMGALGLAIRYRLTLAVPFLQRHADEARATSFSGCKSFAEPPWLATYQPIPLLSLALASLGGPRHGREGYRFCAHFEASNGKYAAHDCLKIPDHLEERDIALGQLHPAMSSTQVFRRLGSPDYLLPHSTCSADGPWLSGEHWEYYQTTEYANLMGSVRITWEAGSSGQRMEQLQTLRLSLAEVNERVGEILSDTAPYPRLTPRIISFQSTPRLTNGPVCE